MRRELFARVRCIVILGVKCPGLGTGEHFALSLSALKTGGGTVSMPSSLCMGSGDFRGGLQTAEDM